MNYENVRKNKRSIIFALLIIICLLYFSDILIGTYIFTERDLAVFFIPPRILWSGMIKNGQVPLWNPFFYCGQPLFASLQPGILYPFNILFLLIPFDFAFNLIIIVHFFLAGIFTYMLIKSIDGADAGAFIGAIIFMLSGYLLSVHNLLIHLLSIIWLPLILLSYHNYTNKEEIKYILYTSFFLTLMFLGGAVEIVYGTFLLLFILMIFKDPFGIQVKSISFKKKGIFLVVIGVLFLSLSAVQLLPFLEMAYNSIRSGGLQYKEAVTWSLSPKDLVQFFLPDIYGSTITSQKYWQHQNWLKTIYTGCIPFALALFFIWEKMKKALPIIIIMAISLILALGGYTFFYPVLFRYIPFFNTIRYPVKFLFIFIFFLSLMAGMGYNSFCRLSDNKNRGGRLIVYTITILSIIGASLWGLMNVYHHSIKAFLELKGFIPPYYNYVAINMHNIKRSLLFCSLLGPILTFAWGHPKKRTLSFAILIAFLTMDLFFANKNFYKKYEAKKYHQPAESMSFLKKDPGLFRIVTPASTVNATLMPEKIFSDRIKSFKEKIVPGFNVGSCLYSIEGSEVIRLKYYDSVLGLIMTAPRTDSTNLLSMLNVKYILSKDELESNELECAEVIGDKDDSEESLKIYKNLNCCQRAFLVKNYRVITEDEEYKKILERKSFNPRELILLDQDPWPEKAIMSKGIIVGPDEEESVIITEYQPNNVTVNALVHEPKLLFLSDSYYPGWKVYVNGVKETIYRANYAFRAVALTPGRHTIEFQYRPKSLIIGALISFIALLAATAVIVQYKKAPARMGG
ncbi:MAG: YfhO family protein [bacterium]